MLEVGLSIVRARRKLALPILVAASLLLVAAVQYARACDNILGIGYVVSCSQRYACYDVVSCVDLLCNPGSYSNCHENGGETCIDYGCDNLQWCQGSCPSDAGGVQ